MIDRLTDSLNFQTQAMVLRSERQRLIASNIANAGLSLFSRQIRCSSLCTPSPRSISRNTTFLNATLEAQRGTRARPIAALTSARMVSDEPSHCTYCGVTRAERRVPVKSSLKGG